MIDKQRLAAKGAAEGVSLTGEMLTDEQAAAEGYIYGVYADIE